MPLILVVDDDEDCRKALADYLRMCGFDTQEADDGPPALQLAQSTAPALIVLDLTLTTMDGWETMRRLREDPRTRRIPIVALSGHSTGPEQRIGFDAVLRKPAIPEQLVATINRQLAGRCAS